MIVVVEGPSGTGKTTWVAAHHRPAAIWEYKSQGTEPDRGSDPDGAARFWAEANARRWQQALEAESEHGMAVCDTDPFKLHYVWCLWCLGEATTSAWMTEARINHEKFGAGRLGLADLILCDIPDANVLRSRREGNNSRVRRKFDLHARLAEPLRQWYSTIEALDPGRVRWVLPPDGSITDLPPPRPDRSDPNLFDKLLDTLPRW